MGISYLFSYFLFLQYIIFFKATVIPDSHEYNETALLLSRAENPSVKSLLSKHLELLQQQSFLSEYNETESLLSIAVSPALKYLLSQHLETLKPVQSGNDSIPAECLAWSKRQFIPENKIHERFPPLLLSFQGSGNTWTRLLIEHMTGYYTGSIDRYDTELAAMFPGEKACGLRMSVIRGHPHSFSLDEGKLIFINDKYERKKCARPGMINRFQRVIFLVRNPYNSIFADFQRRLSNNHTGGAGATPSRFVLDKWVSIAEEEAVYVHKHWSRFVHPMLQSYNINNSLVIRYEDLVHPEMRYDELKRLMIFMNYEYSKSKVDCAFKLSESPKVHRKGSWSVADAYHVNSSLICNVWQHVREFCQNFSYPVFGGGHCI